MCLVYLTIYSCNHTVLTSYTPCAPGLHPQTCKPQKIDVEILQPTQNLPSTCRCSKDGPRIPLDPTEFGDFCVQNDFGIEDVTAMSPAWIFDFEGKKIGTRSRPWRVSDYIVAWYRAKNPVAVGGILEGVGKREREVGDGVDEGVLGKGCSVVSEDVKGEVLLSLGKSVKLED